MVSLNTMTMDIQSVLTLFLITITCLQKVSMAPLTADSEPWLHPCSSTGRPTSLAPLFTVPPPPIDSLIARLNAIVLKYKDGLEIISTLKQTIGDSFQSKALVNHLENVTSIPVFPAANFTILKPQDHVVKEYETLAGLYIFLEQAAIDSTYKSEFQKMVSKVKELLCEFQLVFKTLQIDFTSNVTRVILSTDYKPSTETKRTDRDYIIARDTVKIFTAGISDFQAYVSQSLAG